MMRKLPSRQELRRPVSRISKGNKIMYSTSCEPAQEIYRYDDDVENKLKDLMNKLRGTEVVGKEPSVEEPLKMIRGAKARQALRQPLAT